MRFLEDIAKELIKNNKDIELYSNPYKTNNKYNLYQIQMKYKNDRYYYMKSIVQKDDTDNIGVLVYWLSPHHDEFNHRQVTYTAEYIYQDIEINTKNLTKNDLTKILAVIQYYYDHKNQFNNLSYRCSVDINKQHFIERGDTLYLETLYMDEYQMDEEYEEDEELYIL